MVCLAAHADSDHGGRLRCGPTSHADNLGLAKSLRFLSTAKSHPLCDRADQQRFAVAAGFQPGRKAEGVDLQPEEFVPSPAFCSIYLSQCGSDHRRLLANLCRILTLSREAFLCPR